MKNLSITERKVKDVTILDLAGSIRIGDDSSKLRNALRKIEGDGAKNILLNLAEVSTIDSSGLGELVASFVSIKKNGGELKLFNLTERVSELMVITKLLTVFDVFETEEEAVAGFESVSETSDAESVEPADGEANKAAV